MCKDPEPAETVVSEQTYGQQPFVGIKCNKFAREDHTHGTPTAPSIPQASGAVVTEQTFGQTSNPGTSSEYSRGDHTHGTPPNPQITVPSPAATVVNEQTFGQSPNVGTSTNYAREDHTHGTPSNPISIRTRNDQTANRTLNTVYTNSDTRWMHLTIQFEIINIPGNLIENIHILSDTSNPPTTEVAGMVGADINSAVPHVGMEISAYIKPGDNYKVAENNGGGGIITINRWTEFLF